MFELRLIIDAVNMVDPSGEERKLLGVPAYDQGQSPTCFYVALEGIIKYVKGKFVKVRTLVKQSFTNSNSIRSINKNRGNLKKIYHIKSNVSNGRKSYSIVKSQINKNRPLMAYGLAYTASDVGGHAFNIIGYKKHKGKDYFAIANWGAKKWRKVGVLFGKNGTQWDGANNRIRWPEKSERGRTWYGFRK